MRPSLPRVSFILVMAAFLLYIVSMVTKPLSEGSETLVNGYYTVDTGSVMVLGYHDKDGSMNLPFGPDVKSFQVRGDMIFIARWPRKTIHVDNHFEDVNDGGRCQYWRIDTKTHAAMQIDKAEADVDC